MPQLASYVFKPKHGVEVAKKVLERFCDDFLHYENEGFYFHWRTPDTRTHGRPVPEEHVELIIETENGNLEVWSEVCYEDRELEAKDLTDSFFAVLPSDFWHTGEDGKPDYHFYERELAEVVAALSAENSRVVSFGDGRQAWIMNIDSRGKCRSHTIDLLDYAMTVPIVKERPQGDQLELTL
tara:strand:- start:2370 stop:2915 length:546 start_codon:yes stop_codon:yes gene_type:complete